MDQSPTPAFFDQVRWGRGTQWVWSVGVCGSCGCGLLPWQHCQGYVVLVGVVCCHDNIVRVYVILVGVVCCHDCVLLQ